ncbi:serine hydrolase [Sphingobacterium griseoflavum]|uniref:beta-lactamase n=1 Tax=Sphingobacterium griseoflavum TaxID=1474952 RepID=A0ABQ3HWY8_9SPHI|nr:serine hydrolase [Sphingobacterium griseoflavum]GHE41908.1 hypothetical protein GCM10017764_26420 [Sphingobacterium griseoflavum]
MLQDEIQDFKGDVGIFIQHFKKGKTVSIRADSIFPTASLVKLPLLVGVFKKIDPGELKLNKEYLYRTDRVYGGSGLMQFFKDSVQIDLSTMVSLMLSYSDNVASIWCQELAGGGAAINPLMEQLGMVNTKVNSRTAGREAAWQQYGWGETTARDMVRLISMIRQGKVFDKRLSEKMYRYLRNQYYNERSLAQFPADVATASKTGSIDKARGEVVFVHAPSGDFAFAVLTKNNEDTRWTIDNEAEVLTRKIAALLWNYFEPKNKYTAPDRID